MSWDHEQLCGGQKILERLSKKRQTKPHKFSVRAVYERLYMHEKRICEWELHSCAMSLLDDAELLEEKVDEYPSYVFVTRNFHDLTIVELFEALEGAGLNLVDGYPPLCVDSKKFWMENVIPFHATGYQTPARLFHVYTNLSSGRSYTDLLAKGLTYYPNLQDALEEFYPSYIRREQALSIVIQEDRAMLTTGENKLGYRTSVDAELKGQAWLHDGSTTKNLSGLDLKKTKALKAWLLGESNIVYDYIQSEGDSYAFDLPHDEHTLLQRVRDAVAAGEGLKTEFKQAVALANTGSDKVGELDNTVCAFANADGGLLIIGVKDDGTVQGVDALAARAYKTTVSDAIASYCADLNKRLLEGLTENSCFIVKPVNLYGKWVVVADVTAASRRCAVRSSLTIYRRIGATNMNYNAHMALEMDRAEPNSESW